MISLIFMLLVLFPPDANESVVTKLQNKFEEINNLQANFSQGFAEHNAVSGKFYFAKDNNYRIELSNNIIISDGTTIWNEDLKRKKVVVSNVDDDPLAFSLYEYVYQYPSKCKVEEKKTNDGYLLIFTGNDSTIKFKSAKLWIDEKYLINKIIVTDFGGSSFTLKFQDIRVNKSVDKSLFIYKKNKNTKLIDLR